MKTPQGVIHRWYRVDGMRLVTAADVGASWILRLRDSAGHPIQALWVVEDLPRQTIPDTGSWGLFRIAFYDLGLAVTANYIIALLDTFSVS